VKGGAMSLLADLVEEEGRGLPPHVSLIAQLFSFIGSDPEKAVRISLGSIDIFMYEISRKKQ